MITKKMTSLNFMAIAIITLLPGCIKEFRYQAKQLPIINSYNTAYEHTSHGVTILTRALDKNETSALFNGYGKRLNARKGYIPIQLSITNNTASTWTITPQDIEVPQATTHQIKRTLHHNTAARIALIAVAGAVIAIPTIVVGSIFMPWAILFGIKAVTAASITIGAGVATGVATTTTATMEGMRAKAQNICIEEDIGRVALLHELSINPNQKVTKFIFIPRKEFVAKFQLTITNATNELDTINFDIDLTQKQSA